MGNPRNNVCAFDWLVDGGGEPGGKRVVRGVEEVFMGDLVARRVLELGWDGGVEGAVEGEGARGLAAYHAGVVTGLVFEVGFGTEPQV